MTGSIYLDRKVKSCGPTCGSKRSKVARTLFKYYTESSSGLKTDLWRPSKLRSTALLNSARRAMIAECFAKHEARSPVLHVESQWLSQAAS